MSLSGNRLVQCKWCKFKIHRDWNGARNNGLCMCTAGGYYRTLAGNNENKIAKSKKMREEKAVVVDGSGYHAALLSRETFGCNQWEKK